MKKEQLQIRTDGYILECSALCKAYASTLALDNVDLNIGRGGIVGLLGPNGSGKSTLIKLAMGMLQPTSGEVRIGGLKPCPATKSVTAYLPDTNFLSNWMRVEQALAYSMDFFADFRREKAEAMLDRLGIGLKQPIRTLSKGNKEKLGLILTMAREAELFILDEPIAGVDPAARDFILQTILTNYSPESTVLISTHLIADIEPVLDEVIFLKEGRVVRHDSTDNIRGAEGKSVDEVFREVFRTIPMGGEWPC